MHTRVNFLWASNINANKQSVTSGEIVASAPVGANMNMCELMHYLMPEVKKRKTTRV